VTYTVVTDNAAPVVTLTFAAPPAGQGGFFNATNVPVVGTVTATDSGKVTALQCTDGATPIALTVSGLNTASANASVSVTGDGTHNITCTATDDATNSGAGAGSSNTATINIDATAPTITPSRLTAANANGWNNSKVDVRFACTDGGSGLATINATGAATGNGTTSPLDVSVTSEGANQKVDGTCRDVAGNTGTASVDEINIDKTKPLITGNRASGSEANTFGWNNNTVTVKFACADSGTVQSGIQTDTLVDVAVATEGLNQTANSSGDCTDKAGNEAVAASVPVINIDKTAPNTPTLTGAPAANAAGWNKTAVTVATTDNGDAGTVQSGIASCTAPQAFTTETAGTTANGTCLDKAGNTSAAGALLVKIDMTPPQLTVPSAVAVNATSINGAVVNYSTSVGPDLSGAPAPTCTPASGSTFAPGTTAVNCSSTDAAGNTGSASFNVAVTFLFNGFFQPVDNMPVMNAAKAGRVVPLKWQIPNGSGGFITEVSSVQWVKSAPMACDGAPSDVIETSFDNLLAAGGTVLRWDGLQFIYNWQTEKNWTGCRVLQLRLTDGTDHYAKFQLQK